MNSTIQTSGQYIQYIDNQLRELRNISGLTLNTNETEKNRIYRTFQKILNNIQIHIILDSLQFNTIQDNVLLTQQLSNWHHYFSIISKYHDKLQESSTVRSATFGEVSKEYVIVLSKFISIHTDIMNQIMSMVVRDQEDRRPIELMQHLFN